MEAYQFPLERFGGLRRLERLKATADRGPTPCLYIDLDIVEAQYRRLRRAMPYAEIYYAVKANPAREIVELLARLGSSFDIASRYELDLALSFGVDPARLSYGNTIKKRADIAYAYERGVRLFACDAEADVHNIAELAPGSRVFFRVFTQGTGSDWPLSRKFGAHPELILDMARFAARSGLEPYGISFHVGSQQRDIGEWDDAIARTKLLFEELEEQGIALGMINIGGGFPAAYLDPTHPVEIYTSEIGRFLTERFGDALPRIITEPGRYLVADAGVLVSEVILITGKARQSLYRWVYIDAGLFGGLIEAMGEAIKFPIFFDAEGAAEEIILAGPTCDSMDVLYETYKYSMPNQASTGDRLYIYTTGAYTHTYSSVSFNGFPPLEMRFLPRRAVPAQTTSAPGPGSS